MESKASPNKTSVPEFLKSVPDDSSKRHVKQAYAKYIRDQGRTPKQADSDEISIRMLLSYLQELDDRWMGIPPKEVKTSEPRTLVQRLNVTLGRWKSDHKKVQKTIDSLPQEQDQSEQVEVHSLDSGTISDKELSEQK